MVARRSAAPSPRPPSRWRGGLIGAICAVTMAGQAAADGRVTLTEAGYQFLARCAAPLSNGNLPEVADLPLASEQPLDGRRVHDLKGVYQVVVSDPGVTPVSCGLQSSAKAVLQAEQGGDALPVQAWLEREVAAGTLQELDRGAAHPVQRFFDATRPIPGVGCMFYAYFETEAPAMVAIASVISADVTECAAKEES